MIHATYAANRYDVKEAENRHQGVNICRILTVDWARRPQIQPR